MFGPVKSERKCPGCATVFKRDMANEKWDELGVASPECYYFFLKVVQYNDFRFSFLPLRHLICAAYALQHLPRLEIQIALKIDRDARARSVQNVPLHLLYLFLTFEKGFSVERVQSEVDAISRKIVANRKLFLECNRPSGAFELRAGNLWGAIDYTKLSLDEYVYLIRRFAEKTWDAWFEYHDFIRKLYKTYTT
jgi:hypothetical protein